MLNISPMNTLWVTTAITTFLLLHMFFSSTYLTKLQKYLIALSAVLTMLYGNHSQISEHSFYSINFVLLFPKFICLCFVICVTCKFNCKYTNFLCSVSEYVIDWLTRLLKHTTIFFSKTFILLLHPKHLKSIRS